MSFRNEFRAAGRPEAAWSSQTAPAGIEGIFRKASCPCGGGCPSCQSGAGKLKVSQPNDAAEIEADAIADRVMRMRTR